MRRDQPDRFAVVGDRVLWRDDLRLADVDPDDRVLGAPCQTAGERRGTRIGEAHPVEDCPVAGEAEYPRAVGAFLRLCGHGADLHEPEPEQGKAAVALGVLVEAGCEPERTREDSAQRRDR